MNQNYDPNIGNNYFLKFLQQADKKDRWEFVEKRYLPILTRDFNGTTNIMPYKILEQQRWRVASQALRISGIDYTCKYVKAKDIDENTYTIWLEDLYGIKELNNNSYWVATMVLKNSVRGTENLILYIDRESYYPYLAILRSMESYLDESLDSEGLPLVQFCMYDQDTAARRLGDYIADTLS